MLARSTPVQVMLKCRSSVVGLEALLFGQAGFLGTDLKEDYPKVLLSEYHHLRKKFSLENMPVHLWKFLRLRPVNFPTIRIAQLAAIYYQCPLPFGILIDEKDPAKWTELFDVQVSEYWKSHYHFDRPSTVSEKRLGKDTIDLILINTVIPYLYTFGMIHGNSDLTNKAITTLSHLSPEGNSILRNFIFFGLEFSNAMETQGALELKKNWCDLQRCLDCRIGQELLKKVF